MASPVSSLSTEPNKLRHRSRVSESDNVNGNSSFQSSSDFVSSDSDKHAKEFKLHNAYQDHSKNPSSGREGKSLLGYFMTELTKHYRLEADASEFVERRDRVYTSVYTPKNLEKFLAFGFLQCLDSILYMVTFLPLRILVALMRLLTYPCTRIFVGRRPILDASQVCDLLKGLILIVSCYITSQVDMSMIYHIVRGQSIMKFYVFFNMLDVMDKLVSQFGQDILDSLYWTAVEPRGRKREHFGTIFHLVFATVYVVAHTMMILMQAIILNVAFNSHNKNLLTVMMSNNFVEIKVNVFKRVDKTNLCQITYSDVRERFHYMVLLFFVFVRNMKELQWNWDMALPLLQDAAIVFMVEVFVDWIKHAFITKLSELSASHYGEFSLGLAQDIASSQKKHAFTNFSDQVCRRMGFTPIPLICLLYMVSCSSFTVEGPLAWLLVFFLYLCLMSAKVLNSIILLGWAQRLIDERDKSAQSRGTVVNSQTHPKKEVGKKPAPAKPVPTDDVPSTKLAESNTGLCSEPLSTNPSLSSDSVTWSSSFTVPTHTFVSSPQGASMAQNGQGLASVQSIQLQPSLSLSPPIIQPGIRMQETGTTDMICHHCPPAITSIPSCVHSSSGNQMLKIGAVHTSSSNSHLVSDGAWNQVHTATEPLFSPLPNLMISSSSPPLLETNLGNVSQPHPTLPQTCTSFPQADVDRAQSLSPLMKTTEAHIESTVRSPKRKHSASSINSADSFFMENQEPIPGPISTQDSDASDINILGGDHQHEMTATFPLNVSKEIDLENNCSISPQQPLPIISVHSHTNPTSESIIKDDAGDISMPVREDTQLMQNVKAKFIIGSETLQESAIKSQREHSNESSC